jgi:hypothetical protein
MMMMMMMMMMMCRSGFSHPILWDTMQARTGLYFRVHVSTICASSMHTCQTPTRELP